MNVDGGAGGDAIAIGGSSGRLAGVEGSVFISDSADAGDSLNVNDSDNNSEARYSIQPGAFGFQANGQARVIFYSGIEDLSVDGGLIRNTFDVIGTSSSTPALLRGGPAQDTFNVRSFAGTLDAFAGQVTLLGGDGTDQVNVHDENHAGPATYSINDSLVARGAARVAYSNVECVTLRAARGTTPTTSRRRSSARP